MARKPPTMFEKYADSIASSYGEYGITESLKNIILNGFIGINNMSDEEQINYLKSIQLPMAMETLKRHLLFEGEDWPNYPDFTKEDAFNKEIQWIIETRKNILTKEDILQAYELIKNEPEEK